MKIPDWLPTILGGGVAGIIFQQAVAYLLGMRKIKAERIQVDSSEGRQNFQTLIEAREKFENQLQDQIKTLTQRLDESETEKGALREAKLELAAEKVELGKTISYLQTMMLMLENAGKDLPIPMWTKNAEGVMVWVNPAYSKVFLEPMGKTALQYIGFKDVDVWGEEVGKPFWDNDLELISSNREYMLINETIEGPGLVNMTERYHSFKWKVWQGSGFSKRLLGVGGMSIPTSLINHNQINGN